MFPFEAAGYDCIQDHEDIKRRGNEDIGGGGGGGGYHHSGPGKDGRISGPNRPTMAAAGKGPAFSLRELVKYLAKLLFAGQGGDWV